MPAGRPVTLTPEIQKKICGAILNGNYRNVAAQWAGVPLRTFHRWCQQGKKADSGPMRELWQSVLEAEKAAEIRVVAIVLKAATHDPKHAEWWLERKFPMRWGRYYTLKLTELTRQVKDMQSRFDALHSAQKPRR